MIILKIGGSLFDLPHLRLKLIETLHLFVDAKIRLVVGGGEVADAVRAWDRIHILDAADAHWIAIQSMSVSAQLIARVLKIPIIADLHATPRIAVVDAVHWLQLDEVREDPLPHDWSITSDSIAARIAVVEKAQAIVYMKSVPAPQSLIQAEEYGAIDHGIANRLCLQRIQIGWLNIRAEPLQLVWFPQLTDV